MPSQIVRRTSGVRRLLFFKFAGSADEFANNIAESTAHLHESQRKSSRLSLPMPRQVNRFDRNSHRPRYRPDLFLAQEMSTKNLALGKKDQNISQSELNSISGANDDAPEEGGHAHPWTKRRTAGRFNHAGLFDAHCCWTNPTNCMRSSNARSDQVRAVQHGNATSQYCRVAGAVISREYVSGGERASVRHVAVSADRIENIRTSSALRNAVSNGCNTHLRHCWLAGRGSWGSHD